MSKQITRYQALAGLAIVALGALGFDLLGDFKGQLQAIQHDLEGLSAAKAALLESMLQLQEESAALRALDASLAGSVDANNGAADSLVQRRLHLDREFAAFVQTIEAREKQLRVIVTALDSARSSADSLKQTATGATTAISTLQTSIPPVSDTLKSIAETTSRMHADELAKAQKALEALQPILVAPELDPEALARLAASLGSVSGAADRLLACVQPRVAVARPAPDLVPEPGEPAAASSPQASN